MLTITEISNETRNKLTIYGVLCRNVTIFYRQELASLFQVQEKLKTCRNSKRNFRVAVYRLQSYKNCMATCSSFHGT